MKNPTHHIIPKYKCEELGIDPDFAENLVGVTRKDHAVIHWGYKHDDLEPLFKYVKPEQWIIDLIPIGDLRDQWSAGLIALGEIDGIDMSGENNPMYKHGLAVGTKHDPARQALYDKSPKRAAWKREYGLSSKRKKYKRDWARSKIARIRAEAQGEGTLEGFLG